MKTRIIAGQGWYERLFLVVEELGLTYVTFSPVANGFLIGQYDQSSKFEAGTDFHSLR